MVFLSDRWVTSKEESYYMYISVSRSSAMLVLINHFRTEVDNDLDVVRRQFQSNTWKSSFYFNVSFRVSQLDTYIQAYFAHSVPKQLKTTLNIAIAMSNCFTCATCMF